MDHLTHFYPINPRLDEIIVTKRVELFVAHLLSPTLIKLRQKLVIHKIYLNTDLIYNEVSLLRTMNCLNELYTIE